MLNFEDLLLGLQDHVAVKPPRVPVPSNGWEEFCRSLPHVGDFSKVHERTYIVWVALNEIVWFEFAGTAEVVRIIMSHTVEQRS